MIALISGLIFGTSYFLIIKSTKEKLDKNSKYVAKAQTGLIKVLQEGLGGIRDVILNNTQDLHLDFFKNLDVPMRLNKHKFLL